MRRTKVFKNRGGSYLKHRIRSRARYRKRIRPSYRRKSFRAWTLRYGYIRYGRRRANTRLNYALRARMRRRAAGDFSDPNLIDDTGLEDDIPLPTFLEPTHVPADDEDAQGTPLPASP